jgi:hypothetical protein
MVASLKFQGMIMRLLSWIGKQRTRAIASLVLIGILIPPLGAVLKPHVTDAVIGLLCIAFLRIDASAFHSYFAKASTRHRRNSLDNICNTNSIRNRHQTVWC